MAENEKSYQVIIDKKIRMLDTLTRDEAVSELIKCIDYFETIDIMHSTLGSILEDFRNGK